MNPLNRSNDAKDYHVLANLCRLLQKSGDKILNGESKLAITTECLVMLNAVFRRHSDGDEMEPKSVPGTQQQQNANSCKKDVQFLQHFISKTPGLKIMHTSATLLGGIHIHRFGALRVLEMKKVPVHLVEGLQKLRGQLCSVTVSRSLQHLQDFFELCGGDMSSPMSWPELKSVYLSFNGIEMLDGSLRLLPLLQVLDLSHNNLQTTENYLEYLTELQRLNLGFNNLGAIPSFSLSAKAKLKTLVLRNNNLDNIQGVEEIPLLEDLDISENCLADHANLQPLMNLNRLRRLSTIGNPIYQHRDHRILTLCCTSPVALQKQFELDGKSSSSSEVKTAFIRIKHQSLSVSRRPSSIAHNAIVHHTEDRQPPLTSGISSEYSFYDSDSIATSLPVGLSVHRKGKKRSRLKPTDLDSSFNDEVSSKENSRASSPTKGNSIAHNEIMKTQQEVEVLRDHYGPNWLHAMGDKFQDSTQSDASNSDADSGIHFNTKTPEKSIRTNKNGVINKQTNQNEPSEDDLYLKETFTSINICEKYNSVGSGVLKSGRKIQEEDDADSKCVLDRSDENDVTVSKDSQVDAGSGIDWKQTRVEEESGNVYGEESEPFIVLLVHKNYEQLIVTTNERFLVEKDLNGLVVEQLDLRSLLGIERWEDAVHHNLVDGDDIVMAHIRLTFDYVRRDRRERLYVMEDDDNAQQFEDLLHPFLEEREVRSLPIVIFQCLKCSHHFTKKEAKKATDCLKMPSSGSSLDLENLKNLASIRYLCPKCNTNKVIEVERSPGSQPSSSTSTPVGSYSSGSHFASGADLLKKLSPAKVRTPSLDSQGMLRSPLAKSTPQKQNGNISDSEIIRTGQVNKNLAKDFPPDNSNRPRSNAFTTTQTQSDTHDSQFCVSDVKMIIPREKSASELQEAVKKDQRVRIASVDSDITVLTNPSECSISVISETSSDNDNTKTSSAVTFDSFDAEMPTLVNSVAGDSSRNKEVVTPLGSPLSNSICSSMVSSVYQNSVIAGDEISTETELLVNKSSSDDLTVYEVDTAGQGRKSIYDPVQCSNNVEQVCDPVSQKDTTDSFNENSKEEEESFPGEDNSDEVVTRSRSAAILEQPFTDIDHRLKLHLMMTLFEDTEDFECIFRSDIVQYLIEEEFSGIFIMTSAKFYILRVAQDASSENPADWLKTVDIQPVPELRYIDMGLGCQSFRLEFRTECSCYNFIVRDESRCKKFVDFLEGIIQQNPLNQLYERLDVKIHKDASPNSLDLLRKEVLRQTDDDGGPTVLVRYVMGYLVRGHNLQYPISFVISSTEICLVRENHQWPQPRLQSPLSQSDVGKPFTVLERQAINNIATVEISTEEKTRMRITFFNEKSGDETCWQITMESSNGTQALVDAIREPWETAFGVDLDVAMVTFDETMVTFDE
ncbi:serine/threonine-protein kinase 11-interacting protein-like [Gigantopelta aegis]|uniref:serine/threonine-protein kinase 11-interacting protein-like n=1 Tax=Gigantopelta aegis TaxID=1735272 RepID=UPI001B88C752|nr:serine/threonine-protein kinase 11-interacting protein-like [Gigantopelta aegis]